MFLKGFVSTVILRLKKGEGEAVEMGNWTPIYLEVFAFACTVGAVTLAVLHIHRHLVNYT